MTGAVLLTYSSNGEVRLRRKSPTNPSGSRAAEYVIAKTSLGSPSFRPAALFFSEIILDFARRNA